LLGVCAPWGHSTVTSLLNEPSHSGAMLILALVIPIPWQNSTGYRLTAMSSGSADAVVVDTRRESTALTGTLAPLFNFHPDLSFVASAERELDQIHAQLLPLVERR